IATVLTGTLEFLILDGVNEFQLLALALAPFMIGAAVLITLPNRMLSALGSLNLIFILGIFVPTNPFSYNPESFLFISLFLYVARGLLLRAQTLFPMASSARRQGWIMTSVRHDFEHVLSDRDLSLAPEEAMFRDATRIGRIPAGGASSRENAVLAEALS